MNTNDTIFTIAGIAIIVLAVMGILFSLVLIALVLRIKSFVSNIHMLVKARSARPNQIVNFIERFYIPFVAIWKIRTKHGKGVHNAK